MSNSTLTTFTAVDESDDAGWFVDFMDYANTLPEHETINAALRAALGDIDGATILEAACGTGHDVRLLAEHVGRGGVVGVDMSRSMVDVARARSNDHRVEFEYGDVRGLRFEDDTFDGATIKLARQHCDDVDAVDHELYRVIRPGGRLAVFDYDFETLVVDHVDVGLTRDITRLWVDYFQHGWAGRQLVRRFHDLGLTNVRVRALPVAWPYPLFKMCVAGTASEAQESGRLDVTEDELQRWWDHLAEMHARGTFFASVTGFVAEGTK